MKPKIVITWTKLHPDDLAKQGGRESPQYKLYLPWSKVIHNGIEYPCISTNNPNDCLVMLICRDIETWRMETCNNSYVWTDDDKWIPVDGVSQKWPKYASGEDQP